MASVQVEIIVKTGDSHTSSERRRDQSGAGYVPRLNGKAVKNPHDR